MTRLIVNADDFGLTEGINRAILELSSGGLLTSATLMANAAATEDAAAIARSTPSLGVGCHIVLVDGYPILPAQQIATLADIQTERLQPKLGGFLRQLLTGHIRGAEIEAEAFAQINSLRSRGVPLSHIDTHKHTHMFPAALRPLLRAARTAGIHAVRNPFEPVWSVAATPEAPWIRRTEVNLLRRLEPAFRRIVDEEGFVTTDGAIGVLATGTLDAATVASLLRNLPEGTWELVTHPGYNDNDLAMARTRLLRSREVEREALGPLRNRPDIRLISFADLG